MTEEISLAVRVALITAVMLAALFLLATKAQAQPVRQQYRDCHHNRAGQLVCRQCFVELGKWRCGAPRIVREPAPGWRA